MRFLLADRKPSTRFALGTLLEQHPGWKIVGEVSSGDQLLEQIRTTHPDILLMDWNLPDLKSEVSVPSLKESFPKLAIVIMSGKPELKSKANSAGADAFVSKTEPASKLLGAIFTISEKPES